jgi:phytoene/squalene synthetase
VTPPPDLAACAALVERGDPDRFAATMAAPPAARARLWPLYALNLEVARAVHASDEPMIAEMRLQWWADALGRLALGERAEGETAAALAPLLADRPDLAPLLAALIEARRRDCWREPFADFADLDAYIDRTAGNLAWAAARALGAPAAAERPVRDFAWGAGLANWLGAVPALVARGRAPLPDMTDAGIRALAAEGRARIARARAARHRVPPAARPALWPGWSARTRLRAAARMPDLVRTGRLPEARARRAPALLIRALTGYW